MKTEPMTINLTPPSDDYKYEPENHELHYCIFLGWTVSRIGGNCSAPISDEQAQETLAMWKTIREAEFESLRLDDPDDDPTTAK